MVIGGRLILTAPPCVQQCCSEHKMSQKNRPCDSQGFDNLCERQYNDIDNMLSISLLEALYAYKY